MTEAEPRADRDPAAISEMIREHQARTRESLHHVAKRSGERGPAVTQRYLWDLQNGEAKGFPKKVRTFSAIAEGLQTTELAVLLGFAIELGLKVAMPTFAAEVPFGVDDLPENVRRSLLAVLRALVSPAPVERFPADEALPDLTDDETMLDDL